MLNSAVGLARPRTTRALFLVPATIAAIFVLSFTSFASATLAATPVQPAQSSSTIVLAPNRTSTATHAAPAGAAPKRAVIVVGPVGTQTAEYITDAKTIAAALTAAGVTVDMILPPHATWANVTAVADGADFFTYLGHGNGWPSPYTSNGEESHDGMGLDPTDGDTNFNDVKYYGSNFLRGGMHCTLGVPTPATKADCLAIRYGVWKDYGAGIHLATDAIVLLNHLCYAAGNAEPGMAIPTQSVALQRVDNHANGWLAAGAKVVFALSWQPGQDIVNWLATKHTTMEGLFEMRDSTTGSAAYVAYHGWVGSSPDLYFDSVRTAGATVHLDPDLDPAHRNGYLRAVTGDLDFTTDSWWSAGDGTDTTPPVVTDLSARQASNTIPADATGPAIFTPNGDGISDTVTFQHTLSEPAYLGIAITDSDSGAVVRQFTSYSATGDTTDSWDGKNAAGKVVPDGTYTITVTPTDRSGNVGDAVSTQVLVLTAMKSQTVSPNLFNPRDGDTLAQTSTQSVTLTEDANLTWVVTDSSGNVVKSAMSAQASGAGPISWTWDGTNDSGALVPNGIYWTVVTAQTAAGTYSQRLQVRVMPFKVTATASTASVGQMVKLTIIAAEPLKGYDTVYVKQPGLARYRVSAIRYSSTKSIVSFKLRKGGTAGAVTITITGTDVKKGVNSGKFTVTLR